MSRRVTCPHGHQWELAANEPSLATSESVVCPICGAVVTPLSANGAAESRPAAETLSPLSSLDAARSGKTAACPAAPNLLVPDESAPTLAYGEPARDTTEVE